MSSPRERDRDGFDDQGADGGWQEPAHLGGDGPGDPEPDPRPEDSPAAWEPPGWNLPAGQSAPEQPPSGQPVPAPPPSEPPSEPPVAPPPPGRGGGGLFGRRGPRTPGEVEKVFANEADPIGAQGWAVQNGWVASDGTGPRDAVLGELIAAAPVRLTKDHRPAGVLRGRAGPLELVAFDVLYASGRYAVAEYAITAAPVLEGLPGLRLSPARLWKHRTGGLLQIPGGDEEFDTRWVLLAAEDGPAVRRLVADPMVRALLLGSDDGDEFWSAAGHVAAVRPDGHRPQLIEHHARLLAAIVGALTASR